MTLSCVTSNTVPGETTGRFDTVADGVHAALKAQDTAFAEAFAAHAADSDELYEALSAVDAKTGDFLLEYTGHSSAEAIYSEEGIDLGELRHGYDHIVHAYSIL